MERHAATFLSLALALLVLFAQPRTAHAETEEDLAAARGLFDLGKELAAAGRWGEARARFEDALKLKRSALILYSLALAQRNTGKLVDARESYEAFLAEPVTPATKEFVDPAKKMIAEIEPQIGRVTVKIRPALSWLEGVSVTVDGVEVPLSELRAPIPVDPGEHDLVATAKGYAAARAHTSVAVGGSEIVKLVLQSADGGVKEAEASGPDLVAPIVLMASGSAVLIAGVAVGIAGAFEMKDAPTSDGPEADSARVKGIVGDVLGGTGGVAAGIGLILLIVELADEPGDDEATAPDVGFYTEGPVIGAQLRF